MRPSKTSTHSSWLLAQRPTLPCRVASSLTTRPPPVAASMISKCALPSSPPCGRITSCLRPGHQCGVIGGTFICFGGFGLPENPVDVWTSEDGADWQLLTTPPWNARSGEDIKYDFDIIVIDDADAGSAIYTFGGDRETFDFDDPLIISVSTTTSGCLPIPTSKRRYRSWQRQSRGVSVNRTHRWPAFKMPVDTPRASDLITANPGGRISSRPEVSPIKDRPLCQRFSCR